MKAQRHLISMSSTRPPSKYREPSRSSARYAISIILLLLSMSAVFVLPRLGKHGFGELCGNGGDCRRGICHQFTGPGGYCTHRCSRDGHCREGYFCPPEAGGVCVRDGDSGFGARCSEPYDCASRLCVQVSRTYNFSLTDQAERRAPLLFQRSYCSIRCPVNGTCDDGTECQEIEGLDASVCLPNELIERDIKHGARGFQEVGAVPLFTQTHAQQGDEKAGSSKSDELESTQQGRQLP